MIIWEAQTSVLNSNLLSLKRKHFLDGQKLVNQKLMQGRQFELRLSNSAHSLCQLWNQLWEYRV